MAWGRTKGPAPLAQAGREDSPFQRHLGHRLLGIGPSEWNFAADQSTFRDFDLHVIDRMRFATRLKDLPAVETNFAAAAY